MRSISPLAYDFLNKHPADAARVLEQLPPATVSSLLRSIELNLAAGILEHMLPPFASECLRHLDIETGARFMREIKTIRAARIFKVLDRETAMSILGAIPLHEQNKIQSVLKYPEETVGALMNSDPFCLPGSLSIAEAVRRVRHFRKRAPCEVFIIDDAHKLIGAIHIAHLFSASRFLTLETVLTNNIPFLFTRTPLQSAAHHTGWHSFSVLPVVEHDHSLVGMLSYKALADALKESHGEQKHGDTFNDIFSVVHIYWVTIAELAEVLVRRPEQKGKHA